METGARILYVMVEAKALQHTDISCSFVEGMLLETGPD